MTRIEAILWPARRRLSTRDKGIEKEDSDAEKDPCKEGSSSRLHGTRVKQPALTVNHDAVVLSTDSADSERDGI